MTNHHPQPPYGAMYNPNLPVPPSTAASYPDMQQYHHQLQGYNPYWQAQESSNGVPFAQNTNGYVHHANAQAANPPAFSAGVAQVPYGGYANAAQYSTAPTHFHPAVSNSDYAATPYIPQPLVSSNHIPSNQTSTKNPPNPQHSPAAPIVDMEGSKHPKNSSPELEDGELSGGELSNSNDDLYENSSGLHERSLPEPAQSHTSELNKTSNRNSFDSLDSVNQVPRPLSMPTNTPNVPKDQQSQKIIPSAREEAQAILRELHSYEIGFEEIAREGFKVDLLRGLYAEIGLSVVSLEQQKPRHGEIVSSKLPESTFSTKNRDLPKSQDPSNSILSGLNAATKHPSINESKDTVATSSMVDVKIAGPRNAEPTKDTRLLSVGKVAAKALVPKPLDRKEYVARLMAAKSGKPLPSSDAASVTPQVASDEKTSASNSGNDVADRAQIIATADISTGSATAPTATSQLHEEKSDFEAKRKAQTDLARQKMEALKAQKSSQQQKQTQSADIKAQDTHNGSLVVETAVPAAMSTTDSQQPPQLPISSDRRQGSYFSPVSLKPAFSIPGLFTVSQESHPDSQANLTEPAAEPSSLQKGENAGTTDDGTETDSGPRKRHKAADFMERTSTILQKSLSHGEDTSVIIDISDDEVENPEDLSGHQSFSGDKARPGSAPSGGYRSDKDERNSGGKFPLLSDLSASRRSTQDFATGTPVISNTPGKTQEPQELKTKEIEIEAMNRKILELEQRIRAKQVASRAQSPRVLANAASNRVTAQQQSPNPSILRVDTATEEQLLREKEKQEDKLATAEAEQVRIATVEQQPTAREPSQREEPVWPTDSEILSLEPNGPRDGLPAEPPSKFSDRAMKRQKIELEAELSALDTEMAKAEKKLSLAKLETERIQSDLRIKTNRRQLLQQHLADFSNPAQISHETCQRPNAEVGAERGGQENEHQEVNGVPESADSLPTQSILFKSKDLSPREFNTEFETLSAEPVNGGDMDIIEAADEPEFANPTRADVSEPKELFDDDDDQSSDRELEEDNMDISGSDVDEGQVLESRQVPASKREGAMEISDDEDFYEPPSHIGPTQRSPNNTVENQAQVFDRNAEAPYTAATTLAADQVDEAMTEATENAQYLLKSDADQTPNDGFTQPDAKDDDDDYEPPEPESFVAEDTVPPTNAMRTLGSAGKKPAKTAAGDEQLTSGSAPEDGHFIPYESPLKQFASYRFHPEYRKEVPGGYRSLTYSHNIQPEIPICQYELGGGVCNDESCTSQHFQKMALPDHMILSAMGKGEGSTPQEKEAYIKGLRSLIFDLRERKIKELDAIAEAISHYRLKFLDDATKVLPL